MTPGYPASSDKVILSPLPKRKDHMTEGNGEQHTHEETVKDEHTNDDGTVTVEKTETTEAETNDDA